MQFKYPDLLYFLLVLIIPILIHLFQLRKFKKVPFTNVAFLKNLELQTRKSSTLKKYLILLSRMLAFACLIFAFAQPFLSKNTITKEVNNLIYLDNSLSMNAKDKSNISLFESATQQLVKNTNDKTSFSLLTNDNTYFNLEGKSIKNQLLSLKTSAIDQNISNILFKTKNQFKNKPETINNVILISDFQKEKEYKLDSSLQYHFVQLKPNSINNISIDSVFVAKQTGKKITLTVVLKNYGSLKEPVSVSLYKEKMLLGKSSVDFSKNKKNTSFTFPFEASFNGTISIQDNNLSFDNTFYFSLNKINKIKVLAIGNDTNYLKRIYTPTEFDLKTSKLNSVDYTSITNQNTIVLNELETIPLSLQKELKEFVKNGGSLVFIPSLKANKTNYNSFLKSVKIGNLTSLKSEKVVVNQLHTSQEVLKDVFEKKVTNFNYPFVKKYFPLMINKASNIVSMQNNIGFIQQKRYKKGKIYWFAGAINKQNSNLKSTALIVPLFYNFAKLSFKVSNLYYTIGKRNSFEVNTKMNKDEVLQIKNKKTSFIPLQKVNAKSVKITTEEIPLKAGHFQVYKADKKLLDLAYNYDRKESERQFSTLENIAKYANVHITDNINTVLTNIKKDNSKTELWKWFLMASLLFLFIEMLLIKYFKTN